MTLTMHACITTEEPSRTTATHRHHNRPASASTHSAGLASPAPFPPLGCVNKLLACCCICISFSISIICCSSAYASAHGTPSNSSDVETTHKAFPENVSPLFTQDVVVDAVEAMNRRCVGGSMSCKAKRRSYRVSADMSSSLAMEEASELSDSGNGRLDGMFVTEVDRE